MESEEEFNATFTQWHTYKLVDDGGRIIGGIRYQYDDGVVEVGRLMVHPNYQLNKGWLGSYQFRR